MTSSRSLLAPPGSRGRHRRRRCFRDRPSLSGYSRIADSLRQVRDYAEVERDGHISSAVAADGLAFFGVDELGLDEASQAVLDAICRRFGGGRLAFLTLAIAVSEPTETVEDVYEPI